jgi:hypothetical protein
MRELASHFRCVVFLCLPAVALCQTDPSKIAAARAKGRQQIEQLLTSVGLTIERPSLGSAEVEPTTLEVRLTWDAYATPQNHVKPGDQSVRRGTGFAIGSTRRLPVRVGRDRYPELSSQTLLVVGVGSNKKAFAWTIAHDPLVLRAETPRPSGELSGQILHASRVEMMFTLDYHPSEPVWSTRPPTMRLLGSVTL